MQMFVRTDRVIFCYTELGLCRGLRDGVVGAVPSQGPEAVLQSYVDLPRGEGDLASLDVFLITYFLLMRSELGDVRGEALTLRPTGRVETN